MSPILVLFNLLSLITVQQFIEGSPPTSRGQVDDTIKRDNFDLLQKKLLCHLTYYNRAR